LFAFILECDDHEADEDVYHEESDHDEENNEVDRHEDAVVISRTAIHLRTINGRVH
jgi:hypothetical protein